MSSIYEKLGVDTSFNFGYTTLTLMEETIPPSKDTRATIKVCLHEKCCRKGAEDIYRNLKEGLTKEEALVLPIYECFGFCKEGPNIAINDNIVKGVRPFTAVELVRAELDNPSCKADGLGSKSLDALDDVLEDITKL
jgi:NADH:ubiquinone oxidoreductase subunit E